jgi:threonine dehydratase
MEGAGGAAFAALFKQRSKLRGRRVAFVMSGGYVDSFTFAKILSGATPET